MPRQNIPVVAVILSMLAVAAVAAQEHLAAGVVAATTGQTSTFRPGAALGESWKKVFEGAWRERRNDSTDHFRVRGSVGHDWLASLLEVQRDRWLADKATNPRRLEQIARDIAYFRGRAAALKTAEVAAAPAWAPETGSEREAGLCWTLWDSFADYDCQYCHTTAACSDSHSIAVGASATGWYCSGPPDYLCEWMENAVEDQCVDCTYLATGDIGVCANSDCYQSGWATVDGETDWYATFDCHPL